MSQYLHGIWVQSEKLKKYYFRVLVGTDSEPPEAVSIMHSVCRRNGAGCYLCPLQQKFTLQSGYITAVSSFMNSDELAKVLNDKILAEMKQQGLKLALKCQRLYTPKGINPPLKANGKPDTVYDVVLTAPRDVSKTAREWLDVELKNGLLTDYWNWHPKWTRVLEPPPMTSKMMMQKHPSTSHSINTTAAKRLPLAKN